MFMNSKQQLGRSRNIESMTPLGINRIILNHSGNQFPKGNTIANSKRIIRNILKYHEDFLKVVKFR